MVFVFPALTLFVFFGMIPLSNTLNGFGSLVYIMAALTMGFLLYLLLSVLAIDLLSLFADWPPFSYGVLAISLAALVSVYGMWNAGQTKMREIAVEMKGLQKEIRAMHLSDIHIGHFWGVNFLQQIVDKTNAQNVDVVFITGDLFDGRIRLNSINLEPLKQLKAPIYFVDGNHDGYTGVQVIKNQLRSIGVQVLENEVALFGELQVIGLNHMQADDQSYNMHASEGRSTIQNTMQRLKIDPEKPSVLLHHSPDGIKYTNEKGVDLYLAGHTHAGQLFPINLIARKMFEYNKGLHDYNGTKIYVSQGAGTFGPPMRIGTSSEITLVKLVPSR